MGELRFDSNRLAELMKKKRIGDTELARLSGVSRTMIFYLKKGKRNTASAETVAKIAAALNTTVAYLLGEGEEKQPPMQKLPEPIRQLAEVAGDLSEVRQEELLRIARTLAELDQDKPETPIDGETMRAMIHIADQLRARGGNEDLLPMLEALLRDSPRRWRIDLGGEQKPDDAVQGK